MKYDIVCYGNDVLRSKASPVNEIDSEIDELAESMLETMYAAGGLGLAAEQVGRDEAICVIDVTPDRRANGPDAEDPDATIEMPLVMINPEILRGSGEQRAQEGCLSFPEIYAMITRYSDVECAYTDLKGERREIRVHGLLARAVLHETDHLNGVLFIDRMSSVQRMSVAGKLRRLKRSAKQRRF